MSKVLVTKLEPLNWDSQRFGLKVARCMAKDEEQARDGLVQAVEWGADLLYIVASAALPPTLLDEYNGICADERITLTCSLPQQEAKGSLPSYPKQPPEPELVALAFRAGLYSRFRQDPRIGQDRFELLYREWIEASTSRRIADEVFVAHSADSLDGFITVATQGEAAHIGLVAVAEHAGGKGIGTELVRTAQNWASRRGCLRMSVPTQASNGGALRLYERCGFQLSQRKSTYHFWLSMLA